MEDIYIFMNNVHLRV